MPRLGRSAFRPWLLPPSPREANKGAMSSLVKILSLISLLLFLLKLSDERHSHKFSLTFSQHPGMVSRVIAHPHNTTGRCTHPTPSSARKFYLGAVIFNRVFGEDLFRITAYECKQWIEYMVYAGIEHIFWYDTAQSDKESQQAALQEYVMAGLLTYHRFHHLFPGNLREGYHFEQDNSYNHFIRNYGHSVTWVVEMDIDEYPFSLLDTRHCFLQRLMTHYDRTQSNVTQLLLQCMIFGGNPKGDLQDGWIIERYQRRKHHTEGRRAGYEGRTKPIFRPHLSMGVTPSDPHMFKMKEGKTVVADPEVIRMNHYWGSRLSNFGPDTQEVVEMLESDTSIQAIATELKQATGLVKRNLRTTLRI